MDAGFMDRLPTNSEIANARMPESYRRALKALRRCARKFTPQLYAEAVVALGDAWVADEVESWPDPIERLNAGPWASQVQ